TGGLLAGTARYRDGWILYTLVPGASNCGMRAHPPWLRAHPAPTARLSPHPACRALPGSALRLGQHLLGELLVELRALGDELTVLHEVDQILAGDLLRVEGVEAQPRLVVHVGSQPVAVGELELVPEELLLAADAVDRLHQAVREKVRELPHQFAD